MTTDTVLLSSTSYQRDWKKGLPYIYHLKAFPNVALCGITATRELPMGLIKDDKLALICERCKFYI